MARGRPNRRVSPAPTPSQTASSSSQASGAPTEHPGRRRRKRRKLHLARPRPQNVQAQLPPRPDYVPAQLPPRPAWIPPPDFIPPPPDYLPPPPPSLSHNQIFQSYHISFPPYPPLPPQLGTFRDPASSRPSHQGHIHERYFGSYAPNQQPQTQYLQPSPIQYPSETRRQENSHDDERSHRRSQLRGPIQQRSTESLIPQNAPIPSPEYLAKCSEPSELLPNPKELLVILDLNGTLLHRPKGVRSSAASRNPILRPGLQDFLEYLFANHQVMIWTSARPVNASNMCDVAFSAEQRKRLLAIWARDTLGLTEAQYGVKVQVYKKLDRVWKGEFMMLHPDLDKNVIFDQTNTVLFDDSTEKAASCPWNLVNLPEFKGNETDGSSQRPSKKVRARANAREESVLSSCVGYLEVLKMQSNVSSFMKEKPFAVWKEESQLEADDEDELATIVS